ncbi:MAG TPA: serine hydrolase domain-containing protein [Woeseiaceae bacterium]|nr:serine hydrolase domain-containing protein [Woeseiaceae bacterium]
MSASRNDGAKIAIAAMLAGPLLATVVACARQPDRQLDELFVDYSASDRPGASVIVIKQGVPVAIRSYGSADIERGIAIKPETNFRLASISKQFTATAIMMLVERGELQLDSTLTELLDEFPDYGSNITLRHLLQHNSGLIDYEFLMADDFSGQVSDLDALNLVAERDSTYFDPGTEFRYSNTGYAILAVLVERVSGQPYAEFLEQNIFEPLGMDNTVAYQKGISTVANRAYGYTVDEQGVRDTDQSSTSAVLGDGGIYTSVLDYFKWDQALYTDRLLSRASLEQMWTPNFGDYGFGWRIDNYKGHKRLHHDGETSGFRNYVIRIPDEQLTVLVLTNRSAPDVKPLAEAVVELYLP